jgi:hypothetical protein
MDDFKEKKLSKCYIAHTVHILTIDTSASLCGTRGGAVG